MSGIKTAFIPLKGHKFTRKEASHSEFGASLVTVIFIIMPGCHLHTWNL
jgi:hypothetical protein